MEIKLYEPKSELYKAYLLAAQDRDREAELIDWDAISAESWDDHQEYTNPCAKRGKLLRQEVPK